VRHFIVWREKEHRFLEGSQGSPALPSDNSRVSVSQSHVTTDGQSVSPSWCRAPSGAQDQILITV
jgi:hypothetical protein